MTTKQPPTDKPIPFDREAERSVVASLMVDPDAMDRIDALVSAEDFHDASCRPAFDACRALWRRSEEINQVTVAHELGEHLEGVGGLSFLAELTSDLPTPIGVEHYAAIVRRDSRYRKAISVGSQIVADAYKGAADIEGFLAQCDKRMASLQDESHTSMTPLRTIADRWYDDPGIRDRTTQFVRTGLLDLDDLLLGIKPKTLTVVAAQTGWGKSNLLLNIARNAAVGQNFRVAVVSLEMSDTEWWVRFAANESGVDSRKIAQGPAALNEEEGRLVMEARVVAEGLSINVDERAQVSVETIRATLRQQRAKLDGLDLVLIDYLQLIGNHKRFDSRAQEVGAISRSLKVLSKELDVPIIAAAQLSREVQKRAQTLRSKNGNAGLTRPALPQLSDLRESGSIEQDADTVIFLYRQDKDISAKDWENQYPDTINHPYPLGMVRLIVAKNRNGRTGHCYARMHDAYARIEDIAPVVESEYATPEQFR